MPSSRREFLDAAETAVYLTSMLQRPVSAPYVRVLAHRSRWRRTWFLGRVRYHLDDVDATLTRMASRPPAS